MNIVYSKYRSISESLFYLSFKQTYALYKLS